MYHTLTCLFSVLKILPDADFSSRSIEAVSNENIACIEVFTQIDGQGQTRFTFSSVLDEQLAVTKDCNNERVHGRWKRRWEITTLQRSL